MNSSFELSSIFSRKSAVTAIFAATILAGAATAQITPGLIGQRYVEAAFFIEDIRSSDVENGTGFLVRGNLPLNATLDASVAASLETIDTADFEEKQLIGTLTAHWDAGDSKPFVDVSVANVWQSSEWGGRKYSDDNALYAIGLGIEAAATDTTAFIGRISFNRYFEDDLGDYMLYTIGLNHRLSEKISITGAVSFREDDSIFYSFGLAAKF